jgi:hypothetical protein
MKSSEPKKDKAIGIRLPRETYEALQAKATASRRSLSNYVLLLIENDLAAPGPGPMPGPGSTGSGGGGNPFWSPKVPGPLAGDALEMQAPPFFPVPPGVTPRQIVDALHREGVKKPSAIVITRLNEDPLPYGSTAVVNDPGED